MTTAIAKRKRGLYRKGTAQPKGLPEYLLPEEVNLIIRCAPHERARLVMLEQWRAGLRISESLALEKADLNFQDRTITVRRGKGNRPRLVPMHGDLVKEFEAAIGWGKQRGRLVTADRRTAHAWVKKAVARAIQISDPVWFPEKFKRIGTHTFRHSAARHWLASGVPINRVSLWLGHRSIQTTLIYLQLLPDYLGDMDRVP